MAAPPPGLAANATKAQALAYLKKIFGTYKYHNAAKTPYEGKDYAQVYAYVAARNPGATPHDIAAATADVLVSSEFASSVQGSVTAAGQDIGSIAKGVATANYAPWAAGLGNLLGALTSAALWIRVAKVIVGGTLLIVGLAHMTGADSAVAAAARTVPLPV